MIGGTSLLLLSVAAGYWVLERAANQRGRLKQIGQWLGWFIVVIAVIGTLCKVYALTTGAWGKGYYCPWKPGAQQSAPGATK